jgi:peptidoglycan hydrolase-like protein with peptidoglycan-binding domain
MSMKKIGAKVAGVAAGISLCAGASAGSAAAAPGVGLIGPNSGNYNGVVCVQEALNYWGYDGTPLNVDGSFGQLTYQAVKNYQDWNGLSVDGLVGRDTGSSLLNQWGFTNYHPECWNYLPTWS